ncbi:hypothetical protein CYMTET_27028 [Cymbomonas tetramitiformis]|uniref:Tetratricopeptide repeat protein n=1 Tax=Cymbomonas tetramitiformis TaxID=36881 RepID=A0AAE0FQW5_9CHLO|nr:hypothetical protein CYMTET_27028 [Cymbomonas tetramitiformis]
MLDHLIAAVAEQDSLPYGEPETWYLPVRQCLGAVLYHMGNFSEAAAAFRKDLLQHPNNAWSIWGLVNAVIFKSEVRQEAVSGSPPAATGGHNVTYYNINGDSSKVWHLAHSVTPKNDSTGAAADTNVNHSSFVDFKRLPAANSKEVTKFTGTSIGKQQIPHISAALNTWKLSDIALSTPCHEFHALRDYFHKQ